MPRYELCNLLLRNRGRQVDVPDGQAGEIVISREQAVQEGRTAAKVAQDEERFLNGLCLVTREENIVQEKEEPVRQATERPDQIEQKDESQSFTGKTGRRAFPLEK